MATKIGIKIAYIGGGSTGWAPTLMKDLASSQGLAGEVSLYDIDMKQAKFNAGFGNWLQEQHGVQSKFKYSAANRISDALKGADFVVCSITPAPLETVRFDLNLPKSFGVLQTVGDTVGPGGLLRAMRAIPMYQGFAQAIKTYCPNAWIINYTNPMTVLTRSLTKEVPSLKVFGCCHEVFGTQGMLGTLAAAKVGRKEPIPREEIKTNVMGVNHFTWIDKAEWKGIDLIKLVKEHINKPGIQKKFTTKEVMRQLKEKKGEPWAVNNHQVTFSLLKNYGMLPAAGDRHLAEFVPGYLSNEQEMHRWGIVATTAEFRLSMVKNRRNATKAIMKQKNYIPQHSGEEGVTLIKAILGLGDVVSNVNMVNKGQVSNLPIGAVVESNAKFSKNSVKPINAGSLPDGVAGLVERHARNQEFAVEAIFKRDLNLCFQAFKNDPLMTIPIDKAEELFNKMVKATKPFLKDYK
ncbi:MAG: alpha-glucosidase/alpha-galactosidase [Fibrobacteres bacterium]|nr:alpha-glucosidase/alpha-galactosidase [Fibrobacterota bacterium]